MLVLVLLLNLSHAVQGQRRNQRDVAKPTFNYGFVSPNTEELKLNEAIERLHSAAETRLVNETRNVACRVRAQVRVNKSVGNWKDGAENSLTFRIVSDEPAARYAVASLGKDWRQKTVLYFRRQAGGNARMYLLSVRRAHQNINQLLRNVSKTLDAVGVSYRTLVPLKNRVVVYVVDLSNALQPQVQNAARQWHIRVLTFAGTGGFIGNDADRDQAQSIFTREIKYYEAQHSLRKDCLRNGWKRQ